MPNAIKYSTSAQTLALKKGNFWIGTGDVGKGPSDATGYYNGITPASGGYIIYLIREGAPGDLSYHSAANDAELISFTNSISGQTFETVGAALVWLAAQEDKVAVNREYEQVITDGLIFSLDAGFTPSYPKTGNTWYDIGGNNNGVLFNGPTFDSGNGGSIVFDGINDFFQTEGNIGISGNVPYTFEIFVKVNESESGEGRRGWIVRQGLGSQSTNQLIGISVNSGSVEISHWNNDTVYPESQISFGSWQHIVTTYDGGFEKVYINGINTSTKNIGPLNVVDGKIALAAVSGDSDGSNTLACTISVHRIYSRTLPPREVVSNYNSQRERFGIGEITESFLLLEDGFNFLLEDGGRIIDE